jgi:hypothetical protein
MGGSTTSVETAQSLAQNSPSWVMQLAMYTDTGAAWTYVRLMEKKNSNVRKKPLPPRRDRRE